MKRFLAVVGLFVCTVSAAFAQEPSVFVGIDTIPDSAVVLSREEMRKILAVTDTYTKGVDGVRAHNFIVRRAACDASIIPCIDYNDIRTTPFTFLSRFPLFDTLREMREWVVQQARRAGVKIVTQSKAPVDREGIIGYHGTSLPFVVIDSAGNVLNDNFFERTYARFDRTRNIFVRLEDGSVITRDQRPELYNIREAVAAQKLIYASNYSVKGGKPYAANNGCIGVEEGCVYIRGGWQGTSSASPALGATMASLLAVFPEYDVFDLAQLTTINGCADQYPTLPGGGIVNVPCMIETICAEMNSTTGACAVEQRNLDPVFHNTRIGHLENPSPDSDLIYANVSGTSAIYGWVCNAKKVEVEIEGFEKWGKRLTAGYGTTRTDTRGVCGDDDNGFSFLFNWNHLGDGVHTVNTYADDVKFASTRVKVVTLGAEFLTGYYEKTGLSLPDNLPQDVQLEWWEGVQNFVMVKAEEYW